MTLIDQKIKKYEDELNSSNLRVKIKLVPSDEKTELGTETTKLKQLIMDYEMDRTRQFISDLKQIRAASLVKTNQS